jgi:hypothetical protein
LFARDVSYFCVTYKTEGEDEGFLERGVLSAHTIHEAARKAEMAEKVINVPGWEDCRCECIVPVSIRAYRILKINSYDIDSFFDKQGNLIA